LDLKINAIGRNAPGAVERSGRPITAGRTFGEAFATAQASNAVARPAEDPDSADFSNMTRKGLLDWVSQSDRASACSPPRRACKMDASDTLPQARRC